jgi:hypothetical protein
VRYLTGVYYTQVYTGTTHTTYMYYILDNNTLVLYEFINLYFSLYNNNWSSNYDIIFITTGYRTGYITGYLCTVSLMNKKL